MELSTSSHNRDVHKRNFPNVLHILLQQVELEGRADIVSWRPHGRAFLVHKIYEFEQLVLPRFFRHSRFVSFQRQLLTYNFSRFSYGPDHNSYYNENFIRDRPDLISQIPRMVTKAKVEGQTNSLLDPPNFYEGDTIVPATVRLSVKSTVTTSDVASNVTSPTALSIFQSSLLQYIAAEQLWFQTRLPANNATTVQDLQLMNHLSSLLSDPSLDGTPTQQQNHPNFSIVDKGNVSTELIQQRYRYPTNQGNILSSEYDNASHFLSNIQNPVPVSVVDGTLPARWTPNNVPTQQNSSERRNQQQVLIDNIRNIPPTNPQGQHLSVQVLSTLNNNSRYDDSDTRTNPFSAGLPE